MRKRRRIRWFLFGAGMLTIFWLALEFGGLERPYYSRVCYRCLEAERVAEINVFGVTVRRRIWPSQSNDLMAPGAASVPTTGGAAPYKQIFGKECTHSFKKCGFCRRSGWHLFSMVGCGSYSEGAIYRHANRLVSDVFRAFHRLQATDATRRTYKLIFENDPLRFSPRTWPLENLTSASEWEQWLVEAESDPCFDLSQRGSPDCSHSVEPDNPVAAKEHP